MYSNIYCFQGHRFFLKNIAKVLKVKKTLSKTVKGRVISKAVFRPTLALREKTQPSHSYEWGQCTDVRGSRKKTKTGLCWRKVKSVSTFAVTQHHPARCCAGTYMYEHFPGGLLQSWYCNFQKLYSPVCEYVYLYNVLVSDKSLNALISSSNLTSWTAFHYLTGTLNDTPPPA